MTLILGLVGGKGAGKTSVANYLIESYDAVTWAIADGLKRLLSEMYDLSDEQLYGDQKEIKDERFHVSPRQRMTALGDALRRVYGDDMQINRVLADIQIERPAFAVISDVRYRNEARLIKAHGGRLWRLNYPVDQDRDAPDHQSEIDWAFIDVDLEITPASHGLATLHKEIDRACTLSGLLPFAKKGMS